MASSHEGQHSWSCQSCRAIRAQQEAERQGRQTPILTELQWRTLSAAVEALAIHGEQCGHRRREPECPYCDDRVVASRARQVIGRR